MNYIRPSHVGLALLAGTLAPGPVDAHEMGMPSMPSVSIPSIPIPDTSGAARSAVDSARDAAGAAERKAQWRKEQRIIGEVNREHARRHDEWAARKAEQLKVQRDINEVNAQHALAEKLKKADEYRNWRKEYDARVQDPETGEWGPPKAPAAAPNKRNHVDWGSHPSIEKDPVVGN
jgi:hypothetical protein